MVRMRLDEAIKRSTRRQFNVLLAGVLGTWGAAAGAMLLQQYFLQREVRDFPAYQEARRLLEAHPQAADALGAPLTFGRVKLMGRADDVTKNYVTDNRYQMAVPVAGEEDRGTLYVRAVRAEVAPSEPWRLVHMELAVEGEDAVYTLLESPDAKALLDMDQLPASFPPDDPELLRYKEERQGLSDGLEGLVFQRLRRTAHRFLPSLVDPPSPRPEPCAPTACQASL